MNTKRQRILLGCLIAALMCAGTVVSSSTTGPDKVDKALRHARHTSPVFDEADVLRSQEYISFCTNGKDPIEAKYLLCPGTQLPTHRFADMQAVIEYMFPFHNCRTLTIDLEINNAYTIERSFDGKTWQQLASSGAEKLNRQILSFAIDIPCRLTNGTLFLRLKDPTVHDGFGPSVYRVRVTADREKGPAINKQRAGFTPAIVGVMLDKAFPSYNVSSIDPCYLAELFNERGIDCSLVPIEALARDGVLTITNFKALVNPYGNTFPRMLIKPLRTFRREGGIFVSTGIPLTHPVNRQKGAWKDTGHTDTWLADLLGCGFVTERDAVASPTGLGKRLGLGADLFDNVHFPVLQGPDVSRLRGATVEPLLVSTSGVAYSCIIRHGDGAAPTAVDVWAATCEFGAPLFRSASCVREIIVRATAYALASQGRISDATLQAAIAPAIVARTVENVRPIFLSPRPARFYPSAGPPPTSLLALDMTHPHDGAHRMLAACAQGLVNSDPHRSNLVYLVTDKVTRRWLSWLKDRKYVDSVSPLRDIGELLALVGHKRAVYCDDNPSHLLNIATAVAACDGLLVVRDKALAKQYGLEIVTDLSGRWQSNVDAYQWLIDHYGDRLSRCAVALDTPDRDPHIRDYCVANRIFTFWVSGTIDTHYPGANARDEEYIILKILAERFPVNIPVLGYPWHGHGYGIGEGDGVTMLSRAGKILVPSDHIRNLSVLTRFAPASKPIRPQLAKAELSQAKHYAALVMSDGDNLCPWFDFFPSYWRKLGRHSFPVGWTLGPTIVDLAPPVFDWIRENLPRGDTIGSGVSGVGYVAMDEYGKVFGAERSGVVNEFYKLTGEYCGKTGEEWLWIMRYGPPGGAIVSNYATRVKGIKAIMGGYGFVTSNIDEAAELINGVPVFHCLHHSTTVEKMKREIGDILAASPRKLFLHIFLKNWRIPPDKLRELAEWLAEHNVELVAPETLAKLYKQKAGCKSGGSSGKPRRTP